MPKFSKIITLTVFGIAMGFLEAAVVVYLREMYYPEGFTFPLKQMAIEYLTVEYLREISTIVMLISVGVIAGKNFYERLSYFLFSFGIWDIFYYVWLKFLLNWPPSLLTWDILFLIPVIWVGPVLAPVICAATMILIAGCILHFQKKGYHVKIKISEWLLLLSGAFIIFTTFVWDYTEIIIKGGYISRLSSLATDPDFQNTIAGYVPTSYKWPIFFIGEFLIFIFLVVFCKRTKTFFLSV
ncbi:MAG: hypothetical protein IBX72_05680 [Nitrospirae bacterium]|jgi:hypothetical protein|nr:hypothetical protein [Nitrospirota bacterium]